MPESGERERFETRLGRRLLVSYAAGAAVEGEWRLTFDDDFVPDMAVSIIRVDPRCEGTRADATFDPAGPADFESRLRSFLLGEFADGTDIEGHWSVRFVPDSLPTWEVYVDVDGADELVRGVAEPDSSVAADGSGDASRAAESACGGADSDTSGG